jgi:hypothetical protein
MKYISCIILFALSSCDNNKTVNQPLPVTRQDASEKRTAIKDSFDVSPPSGGFKNPEMVRSIYNAAVGIDKKKISDSVYLENEDFMEQMTDGGGSVTGYFAENRLLKIRQWIGLSYGIIDQTYYFEGDELMYVLEREKNFQVDSNGIDHSRFSDTEFRGDYFFRGRKMVDMVTLGHNRFDTDENEPEKEFLESAAHLRKLILGKRKKN